MLQTTLPIVSNVPASCNRSDSPTTVALTPAMVRSWRSKLARSAGFILKILPTCAERADGKGGCLAAPPPCLPHHLITPRFAGYCRVRDMRGCRGPTFNVQILPCVEVLRGPSLDDRALRGLYQSLWIFARLADNVPSLAVGVSQLLYNGHCNNQCYPPIDGQASRKFCIQQKPKLCYVEVSKSSASSIMP
jgi:hypothetical protein